MYKSTGSKLVTAIITKAADVVMQNDRNKYKEIFDYILEFCSVNDIIIGASTNMNGIYMLLDYPLTKDSFVLDVFTNNSKTVSIKLANSIYEKYKGKFDINKPNLETLIDDYASGLYMKTVMHGMKYEIYVNNRLMVTIHGLDDPKHDIMKMMPTIKHKFQGINLLFMHSSILLIEIYRKLYLPYSYLDKSAIKYDKLLEIENKLIRKLNFGSITGGGNEEPDFTEESITNINEQLDKFGIYKAGVDDDDNDVVDNVNMCSEKETDCVQTVPCEDCNDSNTGILSLISDRIETVGSSEQSSSEQSSEDIAECNMGEEDYSKYIGGSESGNDGQVLWKATIIDIIFGSVLKNSSYIIVGDYANDTADTSARLQYITNIHIDAHIEIINNAVKAKYPNTNIRYVINNAYVPIDFRLKKISIYMTDMTGTKISMFDVYTSTQYETVPYTTSAGLKYGIPIVLLRFRFIDLWLLTLISDIQTINAKYIAMKKKTVIEDIIDIRNSLIGLSPDKILPPISAKSFIGTFTNEDLERRKMSTGFTKNYYPILNQQSSSQSSN